MAKFNLEKAVAKAKFVVEKRKLPNVKAQVLMNMDVSGSARGLFASGQMQEAFQRVLPVGILFDDNKEIDVFTFSDGSNTCHIDPTATESNFADYVQRNILNNKKVPLWGCTDYAPVIRDNLETLGFLKEKEVVTERVIKGGFFSKDRVEQVKTKQTVLEATSDSGFPAIVYFFTDGANADKSETTKLLQEMQDKKVPMYVHFIGIGDPKSFDYIERLGDKFDNTGFLSIRDLSQIDDDKIYDQLLPEELCNWLGAAK